MSLTLFALTGFSLTILLAYLDPVTGAFIVQSIIGGLLGGWYLLKNYSRQIYAYFTGGTEESESASP